MSSSELDLLRAALLNTSGAVPLHARFRALFALKSLRCDDAVAAISQAFADQSALLKHELAYCLGQMGLPSALPVLEAVLQNVDEDPMVRHEAAEAIGAISCPRSRPLLQEHLADPNRSVRETCEIALAKIEWDNSDQGRKAASARSPTYPTIDPAPPSDDVSGSALASIRTTLLDTSVPLFDRYRAMFALRDIGTPAAVDALAAGFADDSALFKHEIAFVFGQLLSTHSVPSLLAVLQDASESDMVRHEAAEALGGIATAEVLPHLEEWMSREDSPRIVRESCQVAIDMWEHENSGQFQYAEAAK